MRWNTFVLQTRQLRSCIFVSRTRSEMPPETRRRPLNNRRRISRVQVRREWKAIEMTYTLSLFALFVVAGLLSVLVIFIFELPNWIIIVIVIAFVCSVAVLTIGLGVFGQRRRMIRRVRRHHLMHAGRHDVYTLPSMFFPPPPAFPPMYSEQMRIPRPTLIRSSRLLAVPPQYEQLFGADGSDVPFSPPPAPGAPPSYASMDRPARRSTDRSTLSPPPGYEESRMEESMEMMEMGVERVREHTVIEITEEIIEENNNETSAVPSVVKVIDCSKAQPEVFEIPQNETVC
ncbi:hypothetical protein PRIPAC_97266 [Pristionchus pacificus]|uniref:Uncharacterized protein n=1 Tax=Pristionchus pacificus TaxID=54126 RepID=A0A2A6CTM6_PRIPA|nr:hypothetical protein PRIPAC_97266 [Pristionchus pacificus]|eukprot:PDM81582.1 hypothetical protein PRIPAC_30563 [Pristionchus pacificus]